MSVIRKTPYIETVIGSLTADQIGTLTSYINGSGTPTTVQLGSAAFAALSGIQLLNLKIDNLRTVSGFLIKTASYCTFISYRGNSEKLIISDINTTTWTITDIEEFLTIEELRRVIEVKEEGGDDADVAKIAIALTQITGSGTDSYTSTPYIKFTPTDEQKAIFTNEKIQIIKLDLTALGDSAPAPYVWVKRNSQVKISTNDVYQFSCGGEQFWYDNAPTDIAIKNVGNGALVYVPALSSCYISFASISLPDLYLALGNAGGTQLYKHVLEIDDDDFQTFYCTIYTTKSNAITLSDINTSNVLNNLGEIMGGTVNFNGTHSLLGFEYDNSVFSIFYLRIGTNIIGSNSFVPTVVRDTITQL